MTSHLRMMTIGAALALLSGCALAEPPGGPGKAKRPVPPPEDGYYVPYVTGPGGEKRSVMETPGSVTVVSRKLMDDQQATTLGDALRNVPGVTVIGR